MCGINDCQDPNITSENIEQYEPPLAARYTLVGTMSGVVLLSMVIFFIGVPAVDFSENKDEKEREVQQISKLVLFYFSSRSNQICFEY